MKSVHLEGFVFRVLGVLALAPVVIFSREIRFSTENVIHWVLFMFPRGPSKGRSKVPVLRASGFGVYTMSSSFLDLPVGLRVITTSTSGSCWAIVLFVS